MTAFSLLVLLGFIVGVFLSVKLVWKRSHVPDGLKEIPGPKGIPVLGNALQLPPGSIYYQMRKWAEQYGKIYQFKTPGRTLVVISDPNMAHDLHVKRSKIYSDRFVVDAFVEDEYHGIKYAAFMTNGTIWNRHRTFFKACADATKKHDFYGHIRPHIRTFLSQVVRFPERYDTLLEEVLTRIQYGVAFGKPDAATSQQTLDLTHRLHWSIAPTGSILNRLDFLKALPRWVCPAVDYEHERERDHRDFYVGLLEDAKISFEPNHTTKDASCWAELYLRVRDKLGFPWQDDLEGAYALGMFSLPGTMLTASPLKTWLLAMLLHPEIFKAIQAEIDALPTSTHGPPEFSSTLTLSSAVVDHVVGPTGLPLLRASITEAIRWHPPVPTGISHVVTQDDEYQGWHIPKGAMVFGFEYGMSRNDARFENVDRYDPMRWMKMLDEDYDTDKLGPEIQVLPKSRVEGQVQEVYSEKSTRYISISNATQFGWGRRQCPGRELAERYILSVAGSLAWAFDLRRKDSDNQLEHWPFTPMAIVYPEDFAGHFDLTVRSEEKKKLLVSFEIEASLNGETGEQECWARVKRDKYGVPSEYTQ